MEAKHPKKIARSYQTKGGKKHKGKTDWDLFLEPLDSVRAETGLVAGKIGDYAIRSDTHTQSPIGVKLQSASLYFVQSLY